MIGTFPLAQLCDGGMNRLYHVIDFGRRHVQVQWKPEDLVAPQPLGNGTEAVAISSERERLVMIDWPVVGRHVDTLLTHQE